MEGLGKAVLGYEKKLFGFRKVLAREYLSNNYDIDVDNLDGVSESDLMSVRFKLALKESQFTNYVMRHGFWEDDCYVERDGSGILRVASFNYEDVQNQLSAPYMKTCRDEWLENCLAHNALRVLGKRLSS